MKKLKLRKVVLYTPYPFSTVHTLLLFVNWWYISSDLIEYGGDSKLGVKYMIPSI